MFASVCVLFKNIYISNLLLYNINYNVYSANNELIGCLVAQLINLKEKSFFYELMFPLNIFY